MPDFDILLFCTDNNAKSRSGLEALHKAEYSLLVLVYEIPSIRLDPKRPREIYIKPRWYRKHWLKAQSCSIYCHEHDIPYFVVHETDLNILLPALKLMTFNYVVVNGWPAKIPSVIGALAEKSAMNCHSSYLPEYRGGNITYAPLINKEKTSGITVHLLTEKLDAGPIIAQRRFDIDKNETTKSLALKRSLYVGELLVKAIDHLEHGRALTDNPPSPFWKRQSYVSYILYRVVNAILSVFSFKSIRREPNVTRLIDKI